MPIKRFIFKLFLFAIPIVFLVVGFEYSLRKIPNDYSYKKMYLDSYSNQIEVLFLGNSHILYGINPELLQYKSFNAAHVSQSINLDLALLEKYENRWKQLKIIIVPIDYFSIYTSLEQGTERWRIKNYNIYYDLSLGHDLKDYMEFTHGKTSKNIERLQKYYIHKKTSRTCNNLGFGLGNFSKYNKDLIKTGYESVRKHTVAHLDSKIISEKLENLKSFQNFAKKHQVKILFVTCPAYKTYTSKLNPSQLNYTIHALEHIAKNNPNVSYINLLYDTTYKAQDFFDADHLNELGAQKFTKQLGQIIKKT